MRFNIINDVWTPGLTLRVKPWTLSDCLDHEWIWQLLISDDVLMDLIAPTEATRDLIGKMIAEAGVRMEFRQPRRVTSVKHLSTSYVSVHPRVSFAAPSSTILSWEVQETSHTS